MTVLQSFLRFLALILLAVFVFLFPLSLALRDVGSLIFDAETTKALIRENLLDAETVARITQQAARQMLAGSNSDPTPDEGAAQSGVFSAILEQLDDSDWAQITELTAPTALIDQAVDEVIGAYTEWLDGEESLPPVELDLAPWKANTQANASQVMAIVLDAQPDCSAEQVASMTAEAMGLAAGLSTSLTACRPPEPVYTTLVDNAEFLVSSALQGAPDSVSLSQVMNTDQAPPELARLKASLVQVRFAVRWAWLAIAAIGVLAVALAARSRASLLRWVGWPLLLTGAITLIFGLGLQFFSLHFLDNLLAGPLMDEAGAAGMLGQAIASGALDLVSRPLLLQGLLLSALGTVAVYSSSVLARRQASPGIPLNQRRIGL